MRDSSSWHKPLRDVLRLQPEMPADPRTANRVGALIAEVELGLTLLGRVAPGEMATTTDALLSGWRYPVPCLRDDAAWAMVQCARFYLVRRRGQLWLTALREYISLPQRLRCYTLDRPDAVPQVRQTSVFPRRIEELYEPALSTTPPHKLPAVHMAKAGRWYCRVQRDGEPPLEIAVQIPEWVEAASRAWSPTPLLRTRTPENPPANISRQAVLEAAVEMDRRLVAAGRLPKYEQTIVASPWRLLQESMDDYIPSDRFKLQGLIHAVGLLNAGKSTLLEVIIYLLARQGRRCALVVNDVANAVRIASLFRFTLGVEAVPVLGSAGRDDHFDKVYQTVLANGMGEDGDTMHPALRWFSQECRLLALTESETRWEYGEEPCQHLFQKTPGKIQDPDRNPDSDLRPSAGHHTCPFYYQCPRHQLERDAAQAMVWVLTPASFVYTHVPLCWSDPDGSEERTSQGYPTLRFAEAVYRECDVLLVDEADRVQVQLDDAFAPGETLVDNTGVSTLNRIGQQMRMVYASARGDMARSRFATWAATEKVAQQATDRFYQLVLTHPGLSGWLGHIPFTARSLFGRIVAELAADPDSEGGPKPHRRPRVEQQAEREERILHQEPPDEVRERRRRLMASLDPFLDAPVQVHDGHRLARLAHELLYHEDDERARELLEQECRAWVHSNRTDLRSPPEEPENWRSFVERMHAAILLAVLDNRLVYLTNHLADAEDVLPLEDVAQGLSSRPPLDYLPVVPQSPVGSIIGFLYTPDRHTENERPRPSTGGRLQYFRYVAVGRALLLRFPHLFSSDGYQGAHTFLISGTSWAPGSPAYHINVRPTLLLESVNNAGEAGDAGIRQSQFAFKWVRSHENGLPLSVSGLPVAKRRKAVEELLGTLCERHGRAPGFFESVRSAIVERGQREPDVWGDRDRLLMITGSYDEAAWAYQVLRRHYPTQVVDEIAPLVRDQSPDNGPGVRRGRIEYLAETDTAILIGPLEALSRGHNVLNVGRRAAFGAALFLNRPMPVPDAWQPLVYQLNADAVRRERDPGSYAETLSDPLPMKAAARHFHTQAFANLINLSCAARSYRTMTTEERTVLCWTLMVSVWQVIGRLIRGGVPAEVYFLDAKFAPRTAAGRQENGSTSLLHGILEVLTPYVQGTTVKRYEQTLGRSLYGAFYEALRNTGGLNIAAYPNSADGLVSN